MFLGANALATACEPIILSRLGLRRTVLFGALLLMIGSIIKSGGMPPIIQAKLEKGEGEWRVYLGFFMVGLCKFVHCLGGCFLDTIAFSFYRCRTPFQLNRCTNAPRLYSLHLGFLRGSER